MGGINHIKLLSANTGLLKKAEHNLTTYSGQQEVTQKNNISKVHFFVRHPVFLKNLKIQNPPPRLKVV